MAHVPDGTLRRLADEPLAVPDAHAAHLHRCRRCRSRNERVVDDRAAAERVLGGPSPVPDVDAAWARLPTAAAPLRWAPPRRWRLLGVGVGGGIAGIGGGIAGIAGGAALAGAAAAATLTVIFSPAQVAPVPVRVSPADMQAITKVFDLTSATAHTWAGGTITGAGGRTVVTGSLATAEGVAGIAVALPSTLPNGVTGSPRFAARAASTVTVTFGPAAGAALDGSTLTVHVGGAVVATYGRGSMAGISLPTLAILATGHPTATSTGASLSQLESYVLSRPGFPSGLAAEVRLLGNLSSTVLPVPTVEGVTESSASVAGAPAVVLEGPSNVAAAVVWEDHQGIVRAVGGLLDRQDVLGVARQLG